MEKGRYEWKRKIKERWNLKEVRKINGNIKEANKEEKTKI